MAKILTTDNYATFKIIKGNRPIQKKKVDALIHSYKSGINLFPYVPILVNKDHYIIEGQHRRAACKELKIDVHYIVVEDFTLQQIAELNSNTDKWKDKDFLNCHIQTGNLEYKTLSLFRDKYSLSIGTAVNLMMNGTCRDAGTRGMDEFRNGTFKVNHHSKAEGLMQKVVHYTDLFFKVNDRKFIFTIQMLLASTEYKHDEVISKLKKNKEEIQIQKSWKDYVAHIEQLFNKGNQKRQIIYK